MNAVAPMGKAEEAARFVRTRSSLVPTIGVVLGSGMGAFGRSLSAPVSIPYGEIPHFPASTAVGHKGELVLGKASGASLAVLSGRAHLYEGYTPQQVAFPVRVLGRLGVKILILTNAAGSVNVNYKPGEIMILEDHINYMGANPLTGPNEDSLGPRFPDMTETYDARLRALAEKACWSAGVPVRKGVYIGFAGPSYETPAEIRMARTLGADAVGMSTIPEAIAARHMGLRVLGLSCITNMAAGVLKKKLDHSEVLEVAKKAESGLVDALSRIIVEAGKA